MSAIRYSSSNGSSTESTAALSDETCRQTVRILHERGSKISLRSLADLLVNSKSTEAGTRDAESAQIRAMLHHVHLPKLAAEELITYNPERGLVETTEHFEQVQPVLSTVIDMDSSLETPMEL